MKIPVNPRPISSDEHGQSIVLVAFVIIGLMAVMGLAIDGGLLFTRSSQFRSALDAATNAGIVEYHTSGGNVISATLRAEQFLAANGWPVAPDAITGTASFTDLQVPQLTVTATLPVEMAFMRLLDFASVDITEVATAELTARPEIYTPTSFEWGAVRKANQFLFGTENCTLHGDPIVPTWTDATAPNRTRATTGGVLQYRIRVDNTYSDTHGTNEVLIEVFDPDTYNNSATNVTISHTDAYTLAGGPDTSAGTCLDTPGAPCVLATSEITGASGLKDEPYHNPFWFVRVDQGWNSATHCGAPNDSAVGMTPTRFELYYYDVVGDALQPVTLAVFTATNAIAPATDLEWVSPGVDADLLNPAYVTGSFLVDTSVIPTDTNDFRNIYLEVSTLSGYDKNVFDVHARPPDFISNTLKNINDRNLWLLNEIHSDPAPPTLAAYYDISGLDVFALGRMPLQPYNTGWTSGDQIVQFALTPVDGTLESTHAYATLFDYSIGATGLITASYETFLADDDPPFTFIDTYPIQCQGLSAEAQQCNDKWTDGMFVETLDFGILLVNYRPYGDPHTWSILLSTGSPVLVR